MLLLFSHDISFYFYEMILGILRSHDDFQFAISALRMTANLRQMTGNFWRFRRQHFQLLSILKSVNRENDNYKLKLTNFYIFSFHTCWLVRPWSWRRSIFSRHIHAEQHQNGDAVGLGMSRSHRKFSESCSLLEHDTSMFNGSFWLLKLLTAWHKCLL